MLISVHMPKCGGASFKKILKDYFKSRFIHDSTDKPMNKSIKKRREEAEFFKNNYSYVIDESCIHGHFLPYKYSNLLGKKKVFFITWLRDPLERLASHYFYWKRTESNINKTNFGNLRKKMYLENSSFDEFCFSEDLQNIYSSYLYQFPIENFDFIGITEHFEDDINFFASNYLNIYHLETPRKNINLSKIEPYFKDFGLLKELKAFHSKDYELYHYALEKRLARTTNSISDRE